MSAPPVPGWRVAWLLTRLRLRRLLNIAGSIGRRRAKRSGTRPVTRTSPLLSGAIGLAMVLAFSNLSWQAVTQLQRLVPGAEPDAGDGSVFGPALLHVLTVELALLCVAGVLMVVGSRELAQADWDLEWLVTLPAATATLLWSRIAERTLANAFGMLALWPACAVLAWQAGSRWAAVPIGLLAALPLLALVAMVRTLIDTGLRLRLAPAQLRNLQAVISVLGMLVFYLTISPSMAAGGRFLLPVADAVPSGIAWTPPGLVLQAIGAPSPADAAALAALLLLETTALLLAGMELLRALLAEGVVAAGVRESGRTGANGARRRPAANATWRWAPASPVQRRELTLLGRDRNFLVQTLVLPVLIVGVQWLMGGRARSFAQLWADPQIAAAIVFGMTAYALMLSAFQNLATEGGALWLLYTFPRPIENVLRDKAWFWGVLALAYPLIGFGCLLAFGPPPGWPTLALIGMVALGVPIYSAIAVALGVFGCDPLAVETRQRLRPSYVYLFALLSGFYIYALFAPHWWQSLVFVVLTVLLAQALWQKARDRLPYLLDPAASPPPTVSTADGLIAAMLFFVLQVLVSVTMHAFGRPADAPHVVLAFTIAGALTYAAVRITQWRAGVHDVPAVFAAHAPRAFATGAAFGLAAAVAGVVYLQVVQSLGLVDDAAPSAAAGALKLGAWMLPLGILAAPLFEEFIFRGLIFRGLRRSLPLLPAVVASAAVFAIVHPPLSMLPVFVMGCCAACAYERSRALLAPMTVHAVYNAVVIGWQL